MSKLKNEVHPLFMKLLVTRGYHANTYSNLFIYTSNIHICIHSTCMY